MTFPPAGKLCLGCLTWWKLHRLTANICFFLSTSTIRQQCWSQRTWRRWSKYPSSDLGQPGTPRSLEHPCLSCRTEVWWRTVCLWCSGGWWSTCASMVRKVCAVKTCGFRSTSSTDLATNLFFIHSQINILMELQYSRLNARCQYKQGHCYSCPQKIFFSSRARLQKKE